MASISFKDRERVGSGAEGAGQAVLDFVLEMVRVIVICATVVILFRWFLFQPFIVKGSSMEPTYQDGEYLIIYQLPYRFPEQFHAFTEDDRGTTIVFHPPNDPKNFYIKRLIGLPGERVKIEGGHVKIFNASHEEGIFLTERQLGDGVKTLGYNAYDDVTLGLDQIYVLGDNRLQSSDSRRIGPIPVKNVVGRPLVRGWPLEKIGVIHEPEY